VRLRSAPLADFRGRRFLASGVPLTAASIGTARSPLRPNPAPAIGRKPRKSGVSSCLGPCATGAAGHNRVTILRIRWPRAAFQAAARRERRRGKRRRRRPRKPSRGRRRFPLARPALRWLGCSKKIAPRAGGLSPSVKRMLLSALLPKMAPASAESEQFHFGTCREGRLRRPASEWRFSAGETDMARLAETRMVVFAAAALLALVGA
jgi:hypothetical protein